MTKVHQLITRLDEFLGFSGSSPSDAAIHKATHSLVHADAARAAKEHGEKFRLAMKDKGISKSALKGIVSQAQQSMYVKHYRKAYTGTRREVKKEMNRHD